MGNSQSQNSSPHTRRLQRVPSLLASSPRSQSSRNSIPPTTPRSLNNELPLPPPPPYTPVDENPSANTLPVPNAGVARAATSATRSNTASSNGSAPTHRRTASATANSSRPPPSHPSSRQARQSLQAPPANPAANTGGFRAEMPAGSRHAHLTIIPPTPPPHDPLHRSPSGPTVVSPDTRTPTRRRSTEDPLELLRKYDVVIVVDDSSSMRGALWHEARDALAGIADAAAKYDTDGVDVHFFNSREVGRGLKNSRAVKRLFDSITPKGITPTGEKLEELLLDYLLQLEKAKDAADAGDHSAMDSIKPINYIVLTDGVPTDDPEPVIVAAARRLDARNFPLSQCGIQFVQIGSDSNAAEALKELDDGLSQTHKIRDMVDTTPYTADGSQLTSEKIIKILLGGVNRRVDKRGGAAVA